MAFINLNDYAKSAKKHLSESAYGYYAGAAADALTHQDNLAAFERIKLLPHVLVDVSKRDPGTTILGEQIDFPVAVAPIAMAQLAHKDREIAIAEATKTAGTIMTVSTLSTTSIERLGQTGARLWFQLYVHKDRGLTQSLVQRAEAAGCKALVLTVDVPVAGYREFLVRQPLVLPEGTQLANLAQYWDAEAYPSINEYVRAQFDPSLTWSDVEAFTKSTKLPVLVKGILRPDDAKRAINSGVAGIIVSNHGGRQLDTVPAAIDALPPIVEAVDGACEVLVDGGIRRGTDIMKALAMGARAVLLGRPILWGLAVNGQRGVEHIFNILKIEYDIAMALCGVTSSQDVPADLVQRYPPCNLS